MNWARRALVYLLSAVLLVALVGTALAVSVDSAFSHPGKIETWLSDSGLYSHFVANATAQAQKSAGSSSSVSLNDTVVQQAANTAFSQPLLEQDVSTFLNSNYAWLEGKTATPDFTIDLTSAKQSFAQSVGQYVETYLAGLPACTPTQLAQLANAQNLDPLSLSCRPSTLIPQNEGITVTQQLASSSSFLGNPVITANSINPNMTSQSRPYYQRFSSAPKLYRAAVRLPWILAALSVLCTAAIFFIALTRRKGLRRIGEVLAVAGVLLILTKVAADAAFNDAEKHIFNNSSIGQLQQSLTDFAHRVESQLVKLDMWFGIGFLVLATAIFILLLATRGRVAQPAVPKSNGGPPQPAPATGTGTPPPRAVAKAKPAPRPKPPRLVQ